MQRYRRDRTFGATYFFTVNTHRRQPLLTTDPFYQALKSSIKEVKTKYPFKIEAFVLLPDHLHCIWKMPENDADYNMRWSLIKRKVSQRCREYLHDQKSDSMKKRQEIGLWQRRFWEHRIRDDEDFETHVNYIHYNPVKHGYVKYVIDWPYSSFHMFVKQGVLSCDWASSVEFNGDVFGEI